MKTTVKIIRCTIVPVMVTMLVILCACSDKSKTNETALQKETRSEDPKTNVDKIEESVEDTDDTSETVEDKTTSYELKDYFGKNIEDVAIDFPSLEISVNEGIYDKDGAQFIDKKEEEDGKLCGPTFDVDSNGVVVGIEYSGSVHSLSGLTTGMAMKDIMEDLKKDGWSVSNVDLTHGTSQIYVLFEKDDTEICIVSDAEGEFGHTEESDVSGNADIISISKKP